MSSNKTENLNLHSWDPEDYFTREEFNENFALIDENAGATREDIAAAHAAADAAQASADTAQASANAAASSAKTAQSTADGRTRVQTGRYTGTGGETKRTITFSFPPKVVFFLPCYMSTSVQSHQASYNSGRDARLYVFTPSMTKVVGSVALTGNDYYIYLSWSGNTLSISAAAVGTSYPITDRDWFNYSGAVYDWIAFG